MMRGDASALAGDFASAKASWGNAIATLNTLYGSLDAIKDPAGRDLADQLRRHQAAPRALAARRAICA